MKKIIEIILSSLFLFGSAMAQQDTTLSTYSGQSEIQAKGSITLTDGFHFTASPGNSLRVFINKSYLNAVPFAGVPSSNQNYISTFIFRKPVTDFGAQAFTNAEVNQTIQYFDGLGRPMQIVEVQASPGFADVVRPIEYDQFGRETIKYQPYTAVGSHGAYRVGAPTAQVAFYASPPTGVTSTANPYAIAVFEPSPLNRVLEQGFPGTAWQPLANSSNGHTAKMEYGINTVGEVKLWAVNDTDNGASATTYTSGKLYKAVSKDENWQPANLKKGTMEEFKDLEGRVVLKRVWETDAKSLSTYYVYDDLGNLRYVLPPAVNENGKSPISSFTESDIVFDQFIYSYHYDSRRRVVKKKIPGKGWDFMVYNKLDQLVLSQDIVQRSIGKWLFTKYDGLGRIVQTGIYVDGRSPEEIQEEWNSQSTTMPVWESRTAEVSPGVFDYTNLSSPIGNTVVQTINYYDSYDFPDNIFGLPTGEQASGHKVSSLLTGAKTSVLGTGSMLLTVNYYDLKGNVVQSRAQNHLDGTDFVNSTYSFMGELLTNTRTHSPPAGAATTTADRYEYDHVGRRLATFQRINGQDEVTLSKLGYNEIGQLLTKKLHNELQSTDYVYNERGWLTSNVSGQFNMQLKYNVPEPGTPANYNGNISNQLWGSGPGNVFSYRYDGLGRLENGSTTSGTASMSEVLTYDEMGNIKTLSRDGTMPRTYHYNGNRLDHAEYLTNLYEYDGNGNAKKDGRNGMKLTYNHLNLPITAGTGTNPSVFYTYDATGAKLKKVSPAGTVDYMDGIQYTNGAIEFIQTEEGVARRSGATYSYEYNLTDHLGNVRATFYQNPSTQQIEVLQRDDYYAFGLRKMGLPNSNTNRYLYNGKELQEELGQYDYGARFYDPVIGRWNSVDPLAEKMRRYSPYVYGNNNPIRFIDPDGMMAMDPGDLFSNLRDAAKDFGKFYNGKSIIAGKEYGSIIYKLNKNNKTYYSYTKANIGNEDSVVPSVNPSGTKAVAYAHSHGAYLEEYDNNEFSSEDKRFGQKNDLTAYVTTPNGSLKEYNSISSEEKIIATNLPSDIKDPDRKNDINPYTGNSEKQDAMKRMNDTKQYLKESGYLKQDNTKVVINNLPKN
jgi:RHS repeat-associated protein